VFTPVTSDWLALGTALVLGLTHALEMDHMLAVSTFVTRNPTARAAAGFGARWGLGHSLAVVVVGGALLLAGATVPPRFESSAEAVVGLTLIGLGAWTMHAAGKVSRAAHHHHPPATVERRGPGAVGILHGLAGTGGVMALLPATLTDRVTIGMGYLVVFSAGVIVGMTAFAMLAATVVGGTQERSAIWGPRVSRALGVLAIGVGAWWIVRALTG
jgi:high-affinity nickel-transport protein